MDVEWLTLDEFPHRETQGKKNINWPVDTCREMDVEWLTFDEFMQFTEHASCHWNTSNQFNEIISGSADTGFNFIKSTS